MATCYWIILFYLGSQLSILGAEKCPNITQICGNITFPYPFRISGSKCGMPEFEIHCKKNLSFGSTQPIPFLATQNGEVQILNVSDNHILVSSAPLFSSDCRSDSSTTFALPAETPFRVSANNTYVTVGCRTLGLLVMGDYLNGQWGGCVAMCDDSPSLSYCTGNGCCRSSIPSNFSRYSVTAEPLFTPLLNASYKSVCGYSGIVDPRSWDMFPQSSVFNFDYKDYWMRLDWAIAGDTCSTAKSKSSYQCDLNADCGDLEWGYLCNCKSGFVGDGYSNGTGCTDIDECSDPDLNDCYPPSQRGRCENTEGSYKCSCIHGSGAGIRNGTRCPPPRHRDLYIHIGLGVVCACLLCWTALLLSNKRRKLWVDKHNNFQRNGGSHLQRLISSRGEMVRIFSLEEMKKATKNFHESLVLGSGGSGTIYKGILPKEGTVVAIKKSKEVDSEDMDQFINEVIIMSQINHRNVMALLGCCLETKVPLLVYEYISNGTLFSHLHEKDHIPWQIRLRIATETAQALSYLHSAASTTIVHRDVKSSNILLSEDYTPKVADFGVSRVVPMDQTHITTVVQGTLGYLDPEYFQTVQLTEKSDVYSFGVVLVELITALKPVSFQRERNQINLAIFFLSTLKADCLFDILDYRLHTEDLTTLESIKLVGNLARRCLSVEGDKRPAMEEVVRELRWIREGLGGLDEIELNMELKRSHPAVEEEV